MTQHSTIATSNAAAPRLHTDLQKILETWHNQELNLNFLNYLHLVRNHQHQHDDLHHAVIEVVQRALAQMALEYPQEVAVVESRYFENQTTQSIANQLNISLGHCYRLQKRAISKLAKTVEAMEQTEQEKHRSMLKRHLEPPTYLNLLGADAHVERLATQLMRPESPWLFSLEGLGGVGKTSLANALARYTIDQGAWENVAWVTARQTSFNLAGTITPVKRPALTTTELVQALLQQLGIADQLATQRVALQSSNAAQTVLAKRLTEQRHLIVIDNLETVADLESLLPLLRRMANPTKFLLTTRESLRSEPDVTHFVVPPLCEEDALCLIRQEAQRNNLFQLATVDDDDLKPIIETVGGNPLALRLVTGQLQVHTLAEVITNLTQAKDDAAEMLYTYIYRRLWESLDEPARLALLAMPLVDEKGGTFDLIAGVTQMDPSALRQAMMALSRLNLVDVRGGLNERRFSIHSLTRAFLQEQVVQWA